MALINRAALLPVSLWHEISAMHKTVKPNNFVRCCK
jgi:hypothetical protein